MLVALWCLLVAGDPASIVGPATAVPGSLVVLDARGSAGSGPVWKAFSAQKDAAGNLVAGPFPGYVDVDAGGRCIFAAPPGVYWFVVSTAADGKGAIASHCVIVGDPGIAPVVPPGPPGPVVPPSPVIPPAPVVPDGGKFGLAAWAKSTAAALPAADRAKLAEIFAGLAARAELPPGESNRIATPLALLTLTDKAASDAKIAGYASLKTALVAKLKEIGFPGRTFADLVGAWKEIAAGLAI